MTRTPVERAAPAVRIRPCRPADAAKVLALWKRASAGASVTDHGAAIRARLRRDRRLFLLAWDGPRLVGSLMGGWDGWRASLARLAVEPAYRGRGIGRMLLEAVEREFRRIGVARVACVVLSDNQGGRAFWSRTGYREDSSVVRYVKDLGRAADGPLHPTRATPRRAASRR